MYAVLFNVGINVWDIASTASHVFFL